MLGQGCGGGALALLPAQRVIAAEKAEHGTAHHVVPEPDGDTGEALAVAVAAEIGAAIRLSRS